MTAAAWIALGIGIVLLGRQEVAASLATGIGVSVEAIRVWTVVAMGVGGSHLATRHHHRDDAQRTLARGHGDDGDPGDSFDLD